MTSDCALTRDAAATVGPPVAVVVLNWNGARDTVECLESLARLGYANTRVVVVDNGSTDDSVRTIRQQHPGIELLETGRNLGYAGGNNAGLRHALDMGAQFVLILNNDTCVAADLLDRLVQAAQYHPEAGVLSARILYSERPHTVWFDGAKWDDASGRMRWPGKNADDSQLPDAVHASDYASGAAMLLRAETIREVGYLDEAFFLVWEEADWCFRARKSGWQCLVVPQARVWHKVGSSFGTEASPLRTYFSVRNQLLWAHRHASRRARLRVLLRSGRRLLPRLALAGDPRIHVVKRLLWGVMDLMRAAGGKGARREYLAARRGIIDFALGRFGDCPPAVRRLNDEWMERQRTSPPEARLLAAGPE